MLDGAVLTHAPVSYDRVRVPTAATAKFDPLTSRGVSFTLHSQCLAVFLWGFSSTIRRAQSWSDWAFAEKASVMQSMMLDAGVRNFCVKKSILPQNVIPFFGWGKTFYPKHNFFLGGGVKQNSVLP